MDYVLIPGASGRAWYWHLVVPRLVERGHRAIAVELPADDDTKGLSDYAQAVFDAAGTAREIVVVASSLGAFTAPSDVLATATPKGDQSRRPFRDPCAFAAWSVSVTVIASRDDRAFPLEFQQELARTRLGVEPVVVAGGHLAALSQPDELTAAILAATAS